MVTPSTQENRKLLEQLKSGLEQTKKYQSNVFNADAKPICRLLAWFYF